MSIRIVSVLVVVALSSVGCNLARYGLPAFAMDRPDGEFLLQVEPFDLAPRTDHAESPQPAPRFFEFPADGWVHGFSVELLDDRGESVPQVVLHHVQVVMPQRRELFNPIAQRLLAAGSETRSAELPATLGVPMRRGDSLLVNAMVHNPTDQAFKGVRIGVRITYSASAEQGEANGSRDEIADAHPFFLHVTAPDEPASFDLPPGHSERSVEVRPAAGGRIVMLGGHLHKHALSLRFEDATTGRTIWSAVPRTDLDGNVVDVPRRRYLLTRGPRLRPDHSYRLTASYYNPTDTTLVDAGMGTLGGVLIPDSEWLQVDPRDPLYLFDLRSKRAPSHGPGPHPHHHRR